MAHELAHAVISSTHYHYKGEYDGYLGHGFLHDRYTKEIRKMMKHSDEYKKFKTW